MVMLEQIPREWEVVCKAVWMKYGPTNKSLDVKEQVTGMSVSEDSIEFTKLKSTKKWMIQQYSIVVQRFDFKRRVLTHLERPLHTQFSMLMAIRESSYYKSSETKLVEYKKRFTGVEKSLIRSWLGKAHASGMEALSKLCIEYSS